MPTLYIKVVNPETDANFKSFDAMQVTAREQLAHPTVVARLGEQVVKRYVEILDKLVPANMQGNTALLSSRHAAAGKIATIIRHHWGKMHFDASVFGGMLLHDALEPLQTPVKVKAPSTYDLDSFGIVAWKESVTADLTIRSNPVLVLNNLAVPGARPSILVHELTHVSQCEDNPSAPVGYFIGEDSRIREELEANHKQAVFDTARIEAGIIIEGSRDDHTRPRTIDFVRKSSNPPIDDPYMPMERTLRVLRRKGIDL